MPINVVCPGCHKRYVVSDKFAGKSGPCPNCKTIIKVPDKSMEVKIHAPKEFARGGVYSKPISRREVKVTPVAIAVTCAIALAIVIGAWVLGHTGLVKNLPIAAAALFVATIPMAAAGYWFLYHDEELAPYGGKVLLLRAAICAAAYTVLWLAVEYVVANYMTGEPWNWLVVVPPFVLLGGLAAFSCFDLDYGSSVLHYCFFLLVMILLRWVAGLGWIWDIPQRLGPPFA